MKQKRQQKKRRRITAAWLRKIGVPTALVAGVILAASVGIGNLRKLGSDYRKSTFVFPSVGTVSEILDGDTFRLYNGLDYRLIGIDAPGRGQKGSTEAVELLTRLVQGQRVWLEYDRYQDDKFGRILAWIWVGCERSPKFQPARYMHLTQRESREGLMENPPGCIKGKLVQEELVRQGLAKVENYADRGPLKYEKRLTELE